MATPLNKGTESTISVRDVKRRDLEKHLSRSGCFLHRHGGGHDIWLNPATRAESAVPRHREIATGTARAICRQLGVAPPPGK